MLEAGRTQTREIRLTPRGQEYQLQFIMDGVVYNVQAVQASRAGEVIACVGELVGLLSGGKVRKGDGRLSVEMPGIGELEASAQIRAEDGRPMVKLRFPDWTGDVYRQGLEALGMHPAIGKRVQAALAQDLGTVAISGPPRSGRTTTLYAMLGSLDIYTTEIVLLEKEREHELDQVRRVTYSAEEPFEEVWPGILREEPDVIALDEVASPEHAESLLEFAATAGCAASALEAPDGPAALLQLCRLSGDPELVSRAMTCTVSQRLVRKLCLSCREPAQPKPETLEQMGISPADVGTWYKPVGCNDCLNSGYHGRTGIFGMLIVTEPVEEVLSDPNCNSRRIMEVAGEVAFRSMYQDGMAKVNAGVTTVAEVRRVLKGEKPREAAGQ
jgi:type II secretory ATPase GspE/PulE/Tfp pilus assembly ATPase PilB-like protein